MMSYRTIFAFDLVQATALNVGGSGDESFSNLARFATNGNDELTIRGASIAGAMFATAEKIYGQNKLPREISSGFGRVGPEDPLFPSQWHVFHTHPKTGSDRPAGIEIRQSVGIRQDTGARAEGVLFDTEVTPAGTRWPVILEIDTSDQTRPALAPEEKGFNGLGVGAVAEKIAANVLFEWQRRRCWLGANVARGLGWLNLENLRAVRLGPQDAATWPNNATSPFEALGAFDEDQWIHEDALKKDLFEPPETPSWRYLSTKCTIDLEQDEDEAEDAYGIDVLSVGGQTGGLGLGEIEDMFLRPEAMKPEAYFDENDPEEYVATTTGPDGAPVPFLPGSGIRGPLRHAFSRFLNSTDGNSPVRDPNVERKAREDDEAADLAEKLFGSLESSAVLLVSDASLEEGSSCEAAILHHHAEDEFVGSVFGTGKFTRTVLTKGRFTCEICFEISSKKHDLSDDQLAMFAKQMTALGAAQHLPIGAAKWRGAGWPKWRFDEWKSGPAGHDPAPIAFPEEAS